MGVRMTEPSAIERLLSLRPKPDLELVSVADRGVPNHERIYLRANTNVFLGGYFVLIGGHVGGEQAFPSRRHAFWLGNESIAAGGWVVLYTGFGNRSVVRLDDGQPGVLLYWNLEAVVFSEARIVPILVQIDPMKTQVGRPGQ